KSERDLEVNSGEFVSVFIINGSPQERHKKVEDIIQVEHDPDIVLCSVQYKKDALNTLRYFNDKGYFIYLHWLNPGYHDSYSYDDINGLVPKIMEMNSMVGKRNGKVNVDKRVKELKDFIYQWAREKSLLKIS